MLYATEQDMIDLFGETEITELTNLDDPGATAVDSTRLTAALEYASNEVDSYLAAQYQLPITSIPMVLTNKVADIVRYHLDFYKAREDVRVRYEDAIKWLKLLAEGKVSLGLVTEEIATIGGVQFFSNNRVFTSEGLSDYAG